MITSRFGTMFRSERVVDAWRCLPAASWRAAPGTGLTRFLGASVTIGLVVLALLPTAGASTADIPNPCSLVPAAVIASAFGGKTAPASSDAATSNTSTCSYKNGLLTIELGYTALTSPQTAIHTAVVKGLPHGELYVYAGSKSQIVFYRGTAANGIYAVIRNFAKIPAAKLEKVAKALNAQMNGLTGSGGVRIIG